MNIRVVDRRRIGHDNFSIVYDGPENEYENEKKSMLDAWLDEEE